MHYVVVFAAAADDDEDNVEMTDIQSPTLRCWSLLRHNDQTLLRAIEQYKYT